ncbi:CBS domain-containing protein [Hazenella sp. IB182357]|uniref:CBS domain-containing protein n=1 Tax=Polycladospora coralii TaxID=2771432 RepID=A0A926RVP2_9BACL|nr:CBS domain-containing protein [Polycladospora coralii]MBD1373814.1 CBS domain-containing protein [Polycladospora coralii]MBS7531983.1 CBS domain-containing protein [Polycladospora coralii]
MSQDTQSEFLFSRTITPLIIPKEKVVVVYPQWSLERALLVLTRQGTNSVPVINDSDQVEGLISKTDILDFLMKKSQGDDDFDFTGIANYKVSDALNPIHTGILADSIFSFAFEVLVNQSYVPIIDIKGKFVGILTRKVMMEKVIEFFKEEYLQAFAKQI